MTTMNDKYLLCIRLPFHIAKGEFTYYVITFVAILDSPLILLGSANRPNCPIYKPPAVIKSSTFVVDSSCK